MGKAAKCTRMNMFPLYQRLHGSAIFSEEQATALTEGLTEAFADGEHLTKETLEEVLKAGEYITRPQLVSALRALQLRMVVWSSILASAAITIIHLLH